MALGSAAGSSAPFPTSTVPGGRSWRCGQVLGAILSNSSPLLLAWLKRRQERRDTKTPARKAFDRFQGPERNNFFPKKANSPLLHTCSPSNLDAQTSDGCLPSLGAAKHLTLTDFRLVAELGRVLLFSWEELELFSSSSSSSSSKLMLLETPGRGRGMGRDKWSHTHTQTPAPKHRVTRTRKEPYVHTCIHTHTRPNTHRTHTLQCKHELGLVTFLRV